MAVYNGERYLRQAIDSILSQTFTDFEFIIIDDGSTDGTAVIIDSYDDPRLHRMKNLENLGLARSLNIGLDTASGEYIARMDSDDVSLPKRLEKQVAYMDERPEIAASGTWAHDIDQEGVMLSARCVPFGKRMDYDFWRPSPLIHPSIIIRVAHLGDLRYDSKIKYAQDYDLWLRLRKKCKLDNLPECLLLYRVHDNSTSQRNSTNQLRSAYESLRRHTELTMPYDVLLEFLGREANPIRHLVLTHQLAKALQRPHRNYMAGDITYAREWLAPRLKFRSVMRKVWRLFVALAKTKRLRGTNDSPNSEGSKPLCLHTKSRPPVERRPL
jgi:glycosyltransferase involved in cell wall biosynthesis